MIETSHTVKVNLRGGVASAGDLYEILTMAEKSGSDDVYFGTRQQLYFNIRQDRLEDLEYDMLAAGINYELDNDEHPNIVSSYVADTIFNTDNWLKEGLYKDIFDLFSHQPRLKINLADSTQTFIPFFTGNLNFISSGVSNYWYLYIRFPKTNQLCCCPVLIYSDDIPQVSKIIEDLIFTKKSKFYDREAVDEQLFFDLLKPLISFAQKLTENLALPDFTLPYYEGFNKYGNNKYWLGIYRRNECFPVSFLKDVCMLCIQTRVGQLYITPWKSLLVKNIDSADRPDWGSLLNKHRLNVRHAANELNWQTEDNCAEGLELKKYLVREFEEADMRTYRLCFAVKTQPRTGLFGSVILKKQGDSLWEIMYTRDFNPNSKDFIIYKKRIPKAELGKHLEALCNIYYNFYSDNEIDAGKRGLQHEEDRSEPQVTEVYQCTQCLSIYDAAYGDELNDILPGTAFDSLENYCCPVCSSPKSDFVRREWAANRVQ
ncbi:MAG: rubredoxin [Sphingobacteriaceae bacterium]|nr:MAG: rubredoxin [Sphingobacteriaceae bacterium]